MSQLFGLVPAGQPVIFEPTTIHSENSFIYKIPPSATPNSKPFSHIVVFFLPGVALPPGAAAAIHLLTPPTNPQSDAFDITFLGALGDGKASAIFKLCCDTSSGVAIGISIEPEATVAAKMQELAARGPSKALPSTLQLAQRIISHAYNFLSGYSGTTGGPNGVEVVPIKAFEQWWKKFESKVRTDPTFLERDV
ncbi:hypothetical protein B0T21DRAFT_408179 [Apiosordaria backusii]|uniref:Hikeshi-like domain-containing protein n=1 Tax=Apiosordaria backusii TaxID=314023 RepID=A0AA40ETG7_9PEZI|nr:hypothetical protein B0T21DRAFT_408179 [Apiosordaria backusii]